jgi:hypothetical protein
VSLKRVVLNTVVGPNEYLVTVPVQFVNVWAVFFFSNELRLESGLESSKNIDFGTGWQKKVSGPGGLLRVWM